uniref:Tungsten-containing aldehyde ferredoxin oxidoreductase n=1 Tax=Candidatus Methanophagaceae archaeon ANME-1 ERB6 TaxID=2759912 RepID=A0A7G9YX15_9EURY|nr:tungsten-containing aldehyde ferredoxin oxidoreductase [Methanosarcinales archaeon ANME-1 ERB6]
MNEYGWKNKILRIDLSKSRIDSFVPEDSILKNHLGGRGLGAKIVYDAGRVEPLAPANLLVFAAGPLTGTSTPSSGRVSLSTKSPLTGTIFDSNCGGSFGPAMKKAGYDAIIIAGKSPEPVFIEIEDDRVELKSAETLWGENVKATTGFLKQKGSGSVACIGRAGEKLVPLASIISDAAHAFGRGGVGAVMGSKNLKAIVVKGTGNVEIFDRAEFSKQKKAINRLLIACPTISKGLSVFGTPFLVKITSWMNVLPIANFRKGEPELEPESDFNLKPFFAKTIEEERAPKRSACYSCPIACKRADKGGGELPEYETVGLMGANIQNPDYEAVVEANRLCNDYGVDTISVAGVLGCYSELRDKGISPKELVNLTRMVGDKQGVGEELGRGVSSFAASEGRPETAIQVKGLSLPSYDPRGVKGLGFSYATSNRGGCHTRAYLVAPEILRKPKAIDPYTLAGKAGHTKIFQDRFAAVDSLVVCKFAFLGAGEEEYANILSAVTGVDYTSEDLMLVGERIWNVERLYNVREGFGKADDILPDRFFEEKVNGRVIDREEFLKTLDEYYRMRGWDENGVPAEDKLERLGI